MGDGPADVPAEVVKAVLRLWVGDRVKEVARIQKIVPEEFKHLSVKSIRTAFTDNVDVGARGSPVLCAIVSGLGAKLRNRLQASS